MSEASGPDPDLLLRRRRWLRGATWLTAGNVTGMVTSAAAGVVLARLLGPAGFGRYSVVVVVVGLAATLVTFRLEAHLVTRLRAGAIDHGVVQEVLRASWLLALAVVGAGTALALALAPTAPLVVLVVASEVALSPLLLGRAVLQAQARQPGLVAAALSGRAVWIALVVAVAAAGPANPLVYILGARVLGLGAELVVVWKLAGIPVRATLAPRLLAPHRHRATLGQATPLVVAGLAGMAYNRADQLILAALRGPQATGLYAAGVRLAELLGAVAPIVDNVTLPGLVELHRRRDDDGFVHAVRDATLLMTVPAGALVALLLSGGAELSVAVLGPEYRGVGPVVGLLAVAEWVTLLGTVSASAALARDQRGVLVRATLAGLAVNVGLNLALIPAYGLAAAAWAAIAGYGVASLYAYRVPARRAPLGGAAAAAARVLVAIAAAWAVGGLPLPLAPRLLGVLAAYALVLSVVLNHDARRAARLLRRAGTAGRSRARHG